MKLINACSEILLQLRNLVEEIRDEDFRKPSVALSQSTIGQHLRHTLEFFICFEQAFDNGIINYDKRNHDKLIETDKAEALNAIERILTFVNNIDLDKALDLEVNYAVAEEDTETFPTTARRELVYNIEHAVHHMAIMKIGIRELAPYISLPKGFGVAVSTIRYKETSVSAR
jgi:uncharacterized damage-inducible protein DinB